MRGIRPLVMTALVFLFLAEAQRAFFASLFGLVYDAVFPNFRPVSALLALLPLAVLLGPFVPLARIRDRRVAVGVGAACVALFRLPMTYPALETRLVGGGLVLAGAAIFLMWAVGHLDRAAVAGGAVAGLVADQLLRLGGLSYDPTLRFWWFPVQAALSALLAGLAIWWSREGSGPEEGDADRGLERRAGGLRLRGALALGALLFADLHLLGLPPVVSRSTGVGYSFAALAIAAAGAVALALALAARRPTRSRGAALAMTGVLTAALLVGVWVDGPAAALVMALGHGVALLLVTRALEPASGRREAGAVASGLAVMIGATALYSLTFYHSFTLPFMAGARPWLFGAVGMLVAGCFILMPRPAELESRARPALATAAAMAVTALAMIALPGVVRAPEGAIGGRTGPAQVRVATWNVHYGFDLAWRFEPELLAEALADAGVDVVALQEVPAGLPTAYGVDFTLWLGHRLGAAGHFAPTVGELLGDAFLSRVPTGPPEAVPLPAGGGDQKQLLRLDVETEGGVVGLNALHLGVRSDDRPDQVVAALRAVGSGPAVVLGDLNSEDPGPVTGALREAGFQDALAGGAPGPTFPAPRPRVRIDWIWVRGLDATDGRVLPATPSDHRAVITTLQIPRSRVR
jgi:endonuclease/exonuclease/phosphatase family metal-dependent hydrolase